MFKAIIVAAGSSRRMGFDKLFADLNGKSVVAHSIAAFEGCAEVDEIFVVTRPERVASLEDLRRQESWRKLRGIVPGGAERHLSVWNGLAAADAGAGDFIAVHDGARPLVTTAMIERCLAQARVDSAACCAAPVSDTLKRADENGRVIAAIDRANVWSMQTPQVFAAADLLRAYRSVIDSGGLVTDEASALAAIGLPVTLIDSSEHNIKITYPPDLALAAVVLQTRARFMPVMEKY